MSSQNIYLIFAFVVMSVMLGFYFAQKTIHLEQTKLVIEVGFFLVMIRRELNS